MSVHEQFAEELALYALGSLDGAERQALEKHLEECASCRRELELLRGDTSLLALTTAGPAPPARARQRLMSAIANEPRLPALRPASAFEHAQHALGGLLLDGLLFDGSQRPRSSSSRSVCCGRIRRFSRTLFLCEPASPIREANSNRHTKSSPRCSIRSQRRSNWSPLGGKPQPRGKAIYQRRNGNLIFLASNLPPLPTEKIYELWLFPANGGAPIAAGLFKPDARGSATVVNPPLPRGVEAKNFVVTLEPESGSHTSPRGTPVIVGLGE